MHQPKIKSFVLASAALTTSFFSINTSANAQDFNIDWKGAPEISSADGNFKMKIRGRIFTDWGTLSDNNGKFADRTELRQARIGVEGVMAKDINYKFEVDFALGGVETKDAFIEWALDPVSVMAGQFKVPVSFEEMNSTRHTLFIERSTFTDAFEFGRQIGLTANVDKNDITFIGGVFQGDFDNGNANQGRVYAARGTYAKRFDGGLIHVGGSAFKRENDEGDLEKRYRQRPPLHLSPNRYIDTGIINAESDTFMGLELVGILGPFNAQAEWGWMTTNAPDGGGQDATFNGGYASVSYFLTGETRGYKKGMIDQAQVKNPVFAGGSGAWQIAARYDVTDLNDLEAGINGGKQTTYQSGVNWHLNNFVRIQANYSISDIDGGLNDGQRINTYGVRFQTHW